MAQAPHSAEVPDELLRQLYRLMLLIRRFEEAAGRLYGLGQIGGYCHLSIGQEAVAAGIGAALAEGDMRIGSHRAHGLALASGAAPRAVMAELLGRASGICGGRAGSLHLASPGTGMFSGQAIAGGQMALGTGLALALARRGGGTVCAAICGEGAAGHGAVRESYAVARQLALPVVFVIENNAAEGDVPDRAAEAEACGIAVARVDGMEVTAVLDAARHAVARCRAGRGPRLIEARTIRYRGHAMADPGKHRTLDIQRRTRERRDPIHRAGDLLLARGVSQDALDAIGDEVREVIADAVAFARSSPDPAAADLARHVLAEGR